VLTVPREIIERICANCISHDIAHERLKESAVSEFNVPRVEFIQSASRRILSLGFRSLQYSFKTTRHINIVFPAED